MLRKLVILGLSACWLLGGAEQGQQKVEIRETEHFDLASGGALKFSNSVGDLTVEAWDEPQVEMTTIKSSRIEVPERDREKVRAQLERITVKAVKQGNDLAITSDFPRHDGFTPTFRNGESLLQHRSLKFGLEYRIRAPRNTRIVVHHDQGQVTIDGIAGDIDATLLGGTLLLHLPEDAQYTIHAKSDLGHVNSDYPGQQKRRFWLAGHQVLSEGPASAHTLNLRVGFGDIIVLKTRIPPTPTPISTREGAGSVPSVPGFRQLGASALQLMRPFSVTGAENILSPWKGTPLRCPPQHRFMDPALIRLRASRRLE